jgi:hypothetical protein
LTDQQDDGLETVYRHRAAATREALASTITDAVKRAAADLVDHPLPSSSPKILDQEARDKAIALTAVELVRGLPATVAALAESWADQAGSNGATGPEIAKAANISVQQVHKKWPGVAVRQRARKWMLAHRGEFVATVATLVALTDRLGLMDDPFGRSIAKYTKGLGHAPNSQLSYVLSTEVPEWLRVASPENYDQEAAEALDRMRALMANYVESVHPRTTKGKEAT